MYPFKLRILVTCLALGLTKYFKQENILFLFALTWALDIIDCNIFRPDLDCNRFEYHRTDKILDWCTYLAILVLFGHVFDPTTRLLLWALLAWRLIGVIGYAMTNSVTYLHIFFDGLNSTMFVAYLASKSTFVKTHYIPSILAGLASKAVLERVHHRVNYKVKIGTH
jgi:hypothetical protein